MIQAEQLHSRIRRGCMGIFVWLWLAVTRAPNFIPYAFFIIPSFHVFILLLYWKTYVFVWLMLCHCYLECTGGEMSATDAKVVTQIPFFSIDACITKHGQHSKKTWLCFFQANVQWNFIVVGNGQTFALHTYSSYLTPIPLLENLSPCGDPSKHCNFWNGLILVIVIMI